MEPRNYLSPGALVMMRRGGHVGAPYCGLVRPVLPGSENRHRHTRVPQELGTPGRFCLDIDRLLRGGLTTTPLAPSRRRAWSETRTQTLGAVTVLRRKRSGT